MKYLVILVAVFTMFLASCSKEGNSITEPTTSASRTELAPKSAEKMIPDIYQVSISYTKLPDNGPQASYTKPYLPTVGEVIYLKFVFKYKYTSDTRLTASISAHYDINNPMSYPYQSLTGSVGGNIIQTGILYPPNPTPGYRYCYAYQKFTVTPEMAQDGFNLNFQAFNWNHWSDDFNFWNE